MQGRLSNSILFLRGFCRGHRVLIWRTDMLHGVWRSCGIRWRRRRGFPGRIDLWHRTFARLCHLRHCSRRRLLDEHRIRMVCRLRFYWRLRQSFYSHIGQRNCKQRSDSDPNCLELSQIPRLGFLANFRRHRLSDNRNFGTRHRQNLWRDETRLLHRRRADCRFCGGLLLLARFGDFWRHDASRLFRFGNCFLLFFLYRRWRHDLRPSFCRLRHNFRSGRFRNRWYRRRRLNGAL